MMNETDEMRAARHELQTLSASDPLAQANMLRHVAAFTLLLTGRPGVEALPGEPLVAAGFRLDGGEAKLLASFTRRDGVERVYIAFDIDDAQGPPIGTGLFRREGGDVVCYGLCRLWSPPGDRRALLVATDGTEAAGHFGFRRGQALRWTAGPVAGDLDAGLRRAATRLERHLRTIETDADRRPGFATVVTNVGQTVFTRPFPLAA